VRGEEGRESGETCIEEELWQRRQELRRGMSYDEKKLGLQ
jgi:hypothetical protein